MKLDLNEYKKRKVCPLCLSLSFKKSYKKFKCDNCKQEFKETIEIELMHKGNRCIDNNIDTRRLRYNQKLRRIEYE